MAPSTQPVVSDWLDEAVSGAPEPWADVARLLDSATPALAWRRSYEELTSTPELEAFRDFYSYIILAGPEFRGVKTPMNAPDILLGFTLQAPNIYYPEHHHRAPEMYGVISGTLEWQVGNELRAVGPGDVIVHRSHESHAMRTFEEPALTWVMWPSDTDSDVIMPSMDPTGQSMAPIHYE